MRHGNRVLLALGAVAVWLGARGVAAADKATQPPSMVRVDPRFETLVPRDVAIERIADGFAWTEGPAWNRETKSLLFSDVPNNAIQQWRRGEGVSLFLKPSGYTGTAAFTGREPGSNGLAFDGEGRLTFAQHGDRRISRLEKDGRRTTLVDRYMGRRLNSPNDLAYKSNGDLYFTDPPFGLPGSYDDPGKELDFNGVYRYSKDGQLSLLTKQVQAPNGVAFSPDEKILYVSDSKRFLWLAFDVRPDGTIGAGRVIHHAGALAKGRPGVSDGMKVDKSGNIFGAGPGGIYVIAPDGALLGRFDFGVATGNCAWGEDGSTLFVTSNTAVYRIRLATTGAGY